MLHDVVRQCADLALLSIEILLVVEGDKFREVGELWHKARG